MAQDAVTASVELDIVVGPILNLLDLLKNQVDLEQSVLVYISVARPLVVLPTVMHPNVGGYGLGAQFIASEDVRDSFSEGGAGRTVRDEHANRLLRLLG